MKQHIPKHLGRDVFPSHCFQIRSLQCVSADPYEPMLADYRIVDAWHVTTAEDFKTLPPVATRPWSDWQLVYRIQKTAQTLSVALLLRQPAKSAAFVLLLGATHEFEVGYKVLDADILTHSGGMLASEDKLKAEYCKPFEGPDSVKLEYHQVSISIEEQVRAGRQKVYMVDIGVHGYPMPPTTQELVEDAAEIVTHGLMHPKQGFHGAPSKAALRSKMKRLWS